MPQVFFSYSHKDEAMRDELEIHLAMLKRQGVISTWHDRRIAQGEDIDSSVGEHLESSEIVLLLVSPYFLASEYCYDVEMSRALQRHDEGAARVIPVILDPCDWQHAPFGKLLATPTDGKPVSKFANRHDAFLEITTAIRRAAESNGSEVLTNDGLAPTRDLSDSASHKEVPRSANLRLRRQFTDRDRDLFRDESYAYIKSFFENSLEELGRRNPSIETRFEEIDARQFTTGIYMGGEMRALCKVWIDAERSSGGIAYAAGDSGPMMGINERLTVSDNGYSLLLKPLNIAFHSQREDQGLTQEGGAELLWSLLLHPLQEGVAW